MSLQPSVHFNWAWGLRFKAGSYCDEHLTSIQSCPPIWMLNQRLLVERQLCGRNEGCKDGANGSGHRKPVN